MSDNNDTSHAPETPLSQPLEAQPQMEATTPHVEQASSTPDVCEPQAAPEVESNAEPERSVPSHMMTYDITTRDGLVYPNRVGPGDANQRGDIDARIEMTPTNGRVTIQTFDRYLERLREFREGKRELRQTHSRDVGHER